MKKIKSVLACIMILMILSAAGCKENEDVKNVQEYYDNSKYINIDISSEDILCFDLVFFTKEKVKNVEFISFAGEGVDDAFNVSVMNNTIDVYENHKYKKLYCSDWMFECEVKNDNTDYVINEIELKINDKVKKIKFDNPIKYSNTSGNDIFDEKLRPSMFSNDFPSAMINSGDSAAYDFVAEKKITLEEVYVNDKMSTDIKIYLNDDRSKEYTMPLEVEAGTRIGMDISYKSDELNKFSYVLTNLKLKYESDGQEYIRKGAIIFNPVSPVSEGLTEIDSYIDYIISK